MPTRSTWTFLFSDIESSTRLWESDPAAMGEALRQHDRLAHDAVGHHGGSVFKHTGDGFGAVFEGAPAAVSAALDVRAALAEQDWGKIPIRVRLGLHTGDAQQRGDDYFGVSLNRAARVMGAANPGQIVASATTVAGCGSLAPETAQFHAAGPHYLRGIADPIDLHIVDGAGAVLDLRPLQSVNSVPTNLPAGPTSLVGRSSHLQEVLDAMRSHRIVTLTGTGGVGKTSLALVAASASRGDFPEGVWFVDLTLIDDPALVMYEIANELDVEPPALRELSDAVADAIGSDRVLIVLDNCEHVVDEAAKAAEVLTESCARASVLATSREGLELRGETQLRVPPLTVPAGSSKESMSSSAARLFVERAQAVRPEFVVDDSNAESIASICRRVDGVPLALELAASRVRVLTTSEVDAELGSAFEVLASRSRSAPDRHRTLEATIRWSYDLASPDERRLFERLGTFIGGFTFEAASAVSELTADRVRDALEGLMAKSLLSVAQGERRRFRLLEALREFARSRCRSSEDLTAAQDAHLAWAASLCAAETPKLLTEDQLLALEALTVELANFRAALRWAVESGQSAVGLKMAAALARFWYLVAYQDEGAAWLDQLLSAGGEVDPVARARALTAASAMQNRIGRTADALANVSEAVELLEGTGELQALGWAHYYYGVCVAEPWYTNAEEVLTAWRTARKAFREAEFSPGVGLATLLIAAVTGLADPESGLVEMRRVLDAMLEAGNPNGIGHAAEFVALFSSDVGEGRSAAETMILALEQHHLAGNWACLAHAFEGVAEQLFRVERHREAAETLGAIDALRMSLSTVRAPYEMLYRDITGALQESLGVAGRAEAHARGASWSRDELLTCSIDAMRSMAGAEPA